VKIKFLGAAVAGLIATGCIYRHEVIRDNAPSVAASPAPEAASKLATIQDTDQFVLHSKIADADFLIQVARPILLAPPAAGQKWPVTYILDGTYMFGLATPLARMLALERSSQATYVVGIGFPEEEFAAYGARRTRDLIHRELPAQNGRPAAGGGLAFERFIKEELRPLIESRYPVDGSRSVLAGHSYGGLFAASVLANDPDAFAGYIIGSPSLQMDPSVPEKVRAAAGKGHGRVFLSVGQNEGASAAAMIGYADALEGALKAPGSGFSVSRKTFAEETHVSVAGAWIAGGLRYVLAPAAPGQK
jgi:predicted alpha/beta superfamily hydrolase